MYFSGFCIEIVFLSPDELTVVKYSSRLKNPINLLRRALRKNKTLNTYLLCVACSLGGRNGLLTD